MLEYLISDEIVSVNDRIAVGVSGGADSMLLLWALLDKQKRVPFYLKVVNVNHNLRGVESDADSKFVADFCKKKKIDYEICSINVKEIQENKKYTLEEAARQARYDAINAVMKKDKLNKLFLAHHKNDQAETVLMHIFRGCGVSGAVGMSESGKVFRPLLNLKKSEIENIVKESGIKFVVDSSNSENDCTRNYLRNIVIPQIEKVYPSAVDAICAFSKKCKEADDFIEKQLNFDLVQENKDGVTISAKVFETDKILIRKYLKSAFEKIEIFADIEQKHYDMLNELITKNVNTCIDLPHKSVARRVYEGIKLFKKSAKKEESDQQGFVIGSVFVEGYGNIETKIISSYDVVYGNGTLYVDYNKIPTDSVWRMRKVGDKFAMLGTGTKSLSDYFTDEKVNLEERDNLPVLASGEKVLVIAGRDISENVKIDGTTDIVVQIIFNPS